MRRRVALPWGYLGCEALQRPKQIHGLQGGRNHHYIIQPTKLAAWQAFCFLNARDVGSAGSTTMPEAGVSPCKGQYWRQAACPQFEAARASNRNETTASQACRFHASVTAKILQSGQFSGKTPRSCLDEDRTCGIRQPILMVHDHF